MKGKSFDELKVKYKATENTETSTDSHLYKLLTKIDAGSQLGEPDINFLRKRELTETLKIVSEMEEKRFAELKVKYKAMKIVSEMEEKRFTELKVKYKATENSDTSPDSHLYKIIIKIEADSQLGESDIKFLREQELTETLKIVSEMEEKWFAELKVKALRYLSC